MNKPCWRQLASDLNNKMKPESCDNDFIGLIFQLKNECFKKENLYLEQFDLTRSEYNCIMSVSDKKVVCGNSLSEQIGLSPSRTSRILEEMVKRGFLNRSKDNRDRRKCYISLAKKGILLKNKIDLLKQNLEQKLCQKLSNSEVREFSKTMKKIIAVF